MNRYDVLGLKPDADPDQIKKAYRALAAKTHPDVAGPVMAPLFMSVQDAYETLSDPEKRAAYDRELNGAPPAPSYAEPPAASYQEPAWQGTPEDREPRQHGADADNAMPDSRARRIKAILLSVIFLGLGGYWVFQEIQLLQLVQPKGGIRMFASQGLPAIVYAVLWALGTLVAAVADDLGTAIKAPVVMAGIAAGFAFITATWVPGAWIPAIVTGLALTYSITAAVRLRGS